MSGWRARLGFLVPPYTPTVEREMYELAPPGVSVHFSRMVSGGPVGRLDNLKGRAESHIAHLDETIDLLAEVNPDVIVLAHTATSYVLGLDAEAELLERQSQRTGVPVISALGSLVAAFEALGVPRVAVGTAYDEALTAKAAEALRERGLEVANAVCLPDVKSIFDETEERVYRLMRRANVPEAEGALISGVGLPTLSLVQSLEEDLGKPVVSSATAMMWNALHAVGIGAVKAGYGQLLSGVAPIPPTR